MPRESSLQRRRAALLASVDAALSSPAPTLAADGVSAGMQPTHSQLAVLR